jgi:hypothetical protein
MENMLRIRGLKHFHPKIPRIMKKKKNFPGKVHFSWKIMGDIISKKSTPQTPRIRKKSSRKPP